MSIEQANAEKLKQSKRVEAEKLKIE